MKLSPHQRPILSALALVFAAILFGCERDTQGGGPAAPVSAKPAPQERFERIIDSFRRKIEDQPVGFVMSDGKTRSTMVGTNKVTSELITPAAAGDHYKAIISVTSQSQYSLRRSKNGSDDNDRDQNNKNQNKNKSADQTDNKGLSDITPDRDSIKAGKDGSKAGSKSNASGEEVVTRRPDEHVRKYELSYDNDRWVLKTPLDPKTEKSIQFAFEESLAIQ